MKGILTDKKMFWHQKKPVQTCDENKEKRDCDKLQLQV